MRFVRGHANRGKRIPEDERFWAKVDRSGGPDACWAWTASVSHGYGVFWGSDGAVGAHRLAWVLTFGQIPAGKMVCHACDNPVCCNPAHLWLGTNAENLADMKSKGRAVGGTGKRGPSIGPERAAYIRSEIRAGRTQYSISKELGLSRTAVSQVARGRSYKSVP